MRQRRRLAGVSRLHKPVLVEAVLSHFNLKPGSVVLDATVGSGGHSDLILKAIQPGGFLIGLDQDQEAIKRSQERLEKVGGRFYLQHLNFQYLDQALSALHIHKIHAVLLDVGVSSDQLESASRGFSFREDGPLDMRMDQTKDLTAEHLVMGLSQQELTTIFRQFGEERYAARIAEAIVNQRKNAPIRTTEALKALVEKAVPGRYQAQKIHPATRVFQALRIAVNDELGVLEEAIAKAFNYLESGGKLAVISFHSLEDRIVKQFFVGQKSLGIGKIITKKPIRPTDEERETNPRARSAKLRVIERS